MKQNYSLMGPVLIVDDEPDALELGAQALRGLGAKVLAASNEYDAMAVIHLYMDELALLVTDIVMPAGNGWTLANLVLELCPNTPVLVTSGTHAGPRLPSSRMAFLAKPFTPSQLATAASALLAGEPVVERVVVPLSLKVATAR